MTAISDSTPSVHIEPEQWHAFLQARPRPVKKSEIRSDQGNHLDSQMLVFLNDVSKGVLSLECKRSERKWLHITAEYLSMESHSDHNAQDLSKNWWERSNAIKTITIHKTAESGLPVNMAAAIQRVENSPHKAARQQAKRQAKQARKARQQEAMDRWSTECQECSEPLVAYNAFYHHSGMGPWCEACIEADEYISGLKWEPKSAFWH